MNNTHTVSLSLESLSGVIDKIRFHNEANGFSVALVQTSKKSICVVGFMPSIQEGQHIEAKGVWHNDPKFGMQFKAETINFSLPESSKSIVKYLGSGIIKGIGPGFAQRLVDMYGSEIFQILDDGKVDKLKKVRGMSSKKITTILSSWEEQKSVKDIMFFLQSHGIGPNRAVKIFKTYGNNAIQLIEANPYQLAHDVRGIGFLTADALAEKLGVEKTSLFRIRAGVLYLLTEATSNGHCALPLEELMKQAKELLQVDDELITEAINIETSNQKIISDNIDDNPCLFPAWTHRAELAIAKRVHNLCSQPVPWNVPDIPLYINCAESALSISLAASQKNAVAMALASKFSVITGGPGVGKTTIMNTILCILSSVGVSPCLAAPTGRAAKRLAESTGMEAKTIHRLLEFKPKSGFRRNSSNPLDCDLLVIDESSMIDIPLTNALLSALPDRAGVILVGDVDQLPSVGPGHVLGDFISSGKVPVARLTEIFRQAADSKIITNAHKINQGILPDTNYNDSDFSFLSIETPEECAEKIIDLVKNQLPNKYGFNPIKDIQVLCPMNRGGAGAQSLNVSLQQALLETKGPSVSRGGYTFGYSDKVMQMENDYDKEVYNGDVGYVSRVDIEEGEMYVLFDNQEVCYAFAEIDSLMPAYAISVHKSQGSEYPVVIIPVITQHYPMLLRNLIYTGVTRGKKRVILVGQKKALSIAVKGKSGVQRRWSNLKHCLQASQPISNNAESTKIIRGKTVQRKLFDKKVE